MWFPVDITDQTQQKRGILQATTTFLAECDSSLIIDDGRFVNAPVSTMDWNKSEELVQRLAACSFAMIGTRHGRPMLPMFAASLAPDLEIAQAKFFLDYEPWSEKTQRFSTNLICVFAQQLFTAHPAIRQLRVCIPLTTMKLPMMELVSEGSMTLIKNSHL